MHCFLFFFVGVNFYVWAHKYVMLLAHIFCSETFFLHASSISVVPSQTTMLVHLIQSQRSNWLTAAIFSAPGSVEIKGSVCSELPGA